MAKIKLYIGIAIAAVIGVLSAMLKLEKAEKKVAEQKADIYKDQLNENTKAVEQVKHAEKTKSNVDKLTDVAIRERLLGKARDRDSV